MGKWIGLALLALPTATLACNQNGAKHADPPPDHPPAQSAPAAAPAPPQSVWLKRSAAAALPMGWPAPQQAASAPAGYSQAGPSDAREEASLLQPALAPNDICRRELLRQAVHPQTIQILDAAPSAARVGTTGLVYLFEGKNRFGVESQWRSHCHVAADGAVVGFRTVLVPE